MIIIPIENTLCDHKREPSKPRQYICDHKRCACVCVCDHKKVWGLCVLVCARVATGDGGFLVYVQCD